MLGFEFDVISLVRKLLYVEGHLGKPTYETNYGAIDTPKNHLQNVSWFIGNSSSYWENPSCGAALMNKDDASTYYFDQYSYDT